MTPSVFPLSIAWPGPKDQPKCWKGALGIGRKNFEGAARARRSEEWGKGSLGSEREDIFLFIPAPPPPQPPVTAQPSLRQSGSGGRGSGNGSASHVGAQHSKGKTIFPLTTADVYPRAWADSTCHLPPPLLSPRQMQPYKKKSWMAKLETKVRDFCPRDWQGRPQGA